MKLVKPQAIIFDWDNTLVNTWPIIHAALEKTFAATGREMWPFSETKRRVRKSMRDSFPEIFGDNWQAAGEIYQGYYRDNHLKNLEALPQAQMVLERVRELGLFSVVVSNKKGPNLRLEVEHLGWEKYFDNVTGSDDAARDKPHADPVLLAFEKTHITPSPSVWFVGDSDIDLECAAATGCTAILYGETPLEQTEYNATHYQGFPYHAHVHNHKQLLELLAGF